MLEGWLDYHRALLLAKCAGLDDEQRKRRMIEEYAQHNRHADLIRELIDGTVSS